MNIRNLALSATSVAAGGLFLAGFLLLLSGMSQVALADPNTFFVKPGGTGTQCSQANPCDLQTALA